MSDACQSSPQAAVDANSSKQHGWHGARLSRANSNDLATYYFDRLALAWRRRNKLIVSYHHDFNDLSEWDGHIHAYLEALVLLKDYACPQGLERLKDPLLNDELFTLALLALTTQDTSLTQACIGLVQGMPNFIEPYAAALTWVDWVACQPHLNLWPNHDESYHRLYLTALAHHNVTLSPQAITTWVEGVSDHAQIATATLRCGISRGEAEWTIKASEWLEADHPELRLAAAEALIVLGPTRSRRELLPILRDLALDSHSTVSENAARKLLTIPCSEGQALLEALAVDENRQRLYLEALGWTGETAAIPLLSERLDNPQQARLAAAVIGSLTGSHPVHDGWQADAPPQATPPEADPGNDALPPPDPDAGLPWPDRARFENWWRKQSNQGSTRQRFLGGHPRELDNLHKILRQGRLAWRPQAAWHQQILQRGRRFPWRAPASHQHHHLALSAESING
jgi:uncharacterized protein (TIGR02270 family)